MLDRLDFVGNQRFEVRKRLGAGGMGVVYEAHDRERDARVALKTLRSLDPQGLFRFKREFRALQDLEHPNLVRLGELIESEGQWFFTMELVRGVDLVTYLRGPAAANPASPTRDVPRASALLAGGSIASSDLSSTSPGLAAPNVARLREVFGQLVRGLEALHASGKVHRDIKPSNVLVTHDGRVVVLDFGLVTERDAHGHGHSTQANIVGTPEYMAPEQAAGHRVDAVADWYSVGVMLYEALEGRLPFDGTALQILVAKQDTMPAPVAALEAEPALRELAELCMRLLATDPAARPPLEEIHAALRIDDGPEHSSGPITQTVPFVGREAELAMLRRAWAIAAEGRPALALVSGESGMGKTELVRRFVGELEIMADGEAPPVVLAGRCYESEAVPYKAFDGVADSLSRFLVRLPEEEASALMPRRAGLLGRLFPVLGRVPVVARMWEPAALTVDPHELRARMFVALRELLDRISERRPVVVTIDDLQWTDADSLVLLEDLLRPPLAPPLLVIATVRTTDPGELERLVPAPLRPHVVHVPVGSLPVTRARELLTHLAPQLGRERPRELDDLVAEAAGHPLFLLELARRTGEPGVGPGTLHLEEVLWDRVSRLPVDARRLLELLAVASAPLARGVAADAFGEDRPAFERAVSLLRVECLTRTTGHDAGRLETYHDRIREAVLAHLGEDDKRALHGRLAGALEWAGAAKNDPHTLVRHLTAAGETVRAAASAEEAARLAADALAFERAAELYETTLALGRHAPDERRRILVARAHALTLAGRGPEAADTYLDAVDGADSTMRQDCRRRAAEQLFMTGHLERGSRLIEELFADSGMAMPRSRAGALALHLAERFRMQLRGYGWKRRTIGEISASEIARLDASLPVVTSYASVDPILCGAFTTRWVREALALGEPERVAKALYLEAVYLVTFGGRVRARGLALIDELGRAPPWDHPGIVGWRRGALGTAAFHEGRYEACISDTFAADSQAHEAQLPLSFLNTARSHLLFGLIHAGRLRGLREQFDVYLRDAQRRGDRNMETTSRRVCSLTALADDRVEEARRLIDTAGWAPLPGLYHLQQWWELEARVQLALYAGTAAETLDELRVLLGQCQRALLSQIEVIAMLRDWLEARLLVAVAPRHPQRAAFLRRAARYARKVARVPTPPGRVWAGLTTAAIATQQGRPERAVADLREAIGRADRAGMTSCAAVGRYRLAQLIGGEEAAAELARAQRWAEAEGVVRLDRFAEVLAPGFVP